VRIPVSGCPSHRWSRALTGHLVNELTGHAAVGHLRLNNIVQADQIVLEGVEAAEAPYLGDILQRAVDAINDALARTDARNRPDTNVSAAKPSAIARQVQTSQVR
jgi:hypothetical protein